MRVQKEVVIFDNEKTYHITLSREVQRKWPQTALKIVTMAMIAVFMFGVGSIDSDSLLPILLVIASGAWLGFRGISESVRMYAEETDQP